MEDHLGHSVEVSNGLGQRYSLQQAVARFKEAVPVVHINVLYYRALEDRSVAFFSTGFKTAKKSERGNWRQLLLRWVRRLLMLYSLSLG